MLIPYRTVGHYGEAEWEIQKSRFISYVARVESEEAAQAFIEQIRKKHWDATHNCSAYIVGPRGELQKADDDGEPSGTAGRPILEVIKKQNLTETVIVVTRYFGGIKLGAGGLIRAYGKSASEGVKAAGIIERQLFRRIAVTCDYGLLGLLENNLRSREYLLDGKEFTDQVTLYVLKRSEDQFLEQHIADWTAGQAAVELGDETYVDVAVE